MVSWCSSTIRLRSSWSLGTYTFPRKRISPCSVFHSFSPFLSATGAPLFNCSTASTNFSSYALDSRICLSSLSSPSTHAIPLLIAFTQNTSGLSKVCSALSIPSGLRSDRLDRASGLPPNRPGRCWMVKSNWLRNRLHRACRRVRDRDDEK